MIAADVEAFIAAGGAGVSLPAGGASFANLPPFEEVNVKMVQKITAARLLESKTTVPHYYLSVEVSTDNLMKMRAMLNDSMANPKAKEPPPKVSVNDMVIKAASLALRDVPQMNASWHGDHIKQYSGVHMSIAVQTEHGLFVPVVRNSDKLGLKGISAAVKELAGKARDGKLKPSEYDGGTFTISNLGMYDIRQFSAIINPPQAGILAVGSSSKKVVPTKDGGFAESSTMIATLSADHRVVDGAVGALWLKAFKGYMEDPSTMLL